ncbi:Vga family ABC-F type ribosomal protection protein [Sporosarcina sp. FSL W7-1349]|uniref:Vga family ABC-F type ribosomal protection protein n=1 Tax=Sporosarcina sp. FSL W7-1349 TaxID=2921561 RepID=UPI0030F5EC1D
MLLIEAHHIKHYVQDRLLLQAEHLQVHQNDRIGLVGRNGSGKTTLLQIIAGRYAPEEGTVLRHARCSLLPQLKRVDSKKSGGEVTQEYIQQVLLEHPELLLADEPTTHLDTDHIEWLEKKFGEWQGALLIVSHDRAFLDALCTKIWEIQDGTITEYTGNYSDYMEQKKVARQQHQAAYEKYEKKKKQLVDALKLKEKKAERATKAPKKTSSSEARITGAKPYFAKKQKKLQKTAKAIETRLEKLEIVEKRKETAPLKMDVVNEENFKDRIILRIENVEGKIGDRLLWKKTGFYVRGGDKLAIVGPNGSGKTMFLRKLVQQDPGMIFSPSVNWGYFSQHLTILDVEKTIIDNVQSSSKQDETLIRTVLARMHFFGEDVHKPVHVLSGGERVKVALAKLFLSDCNTLILDEPTNFLDTEAVEALESLLKDYAGSVIFASHDRRFIEEVANRIVVIRDQEMEVFEGDWHQYQNKPTTTQGTDQDRRLLLETKISDVLSRLSIEPSPELEREFQKLLKEKKELDG